METLEYEFFFGELLGGIFDFVKNYYIYSKKTRKGVVDIDISLFTQKAFLIEDLDYEQFVTTIIPLTDDWESAYKSVVEGAILTTDDVGSGYFIEKQEENWIILNDFKPTGRIITKVEEKEFIIKCMEAKKADLEYEFLKEKRHWANKKF